MNERIVSIVERIGAVIIVEDTAGATGAVPLARIGETEDESTRAMTQTVASSPDADDADTGHARGLVYRLDTADGLGGRVDDEDGALGLRLVLRRGCAALVARHVSDAGPEIRPLEILDAVVCGVLVEVVHLSLSGRRCS